MSTTTHKMLRSPTGNPEAAYNHITINPGQTYSAITKRPRSIVLSQFLNCDPFKRTPNTATGPSSSIIKSALCHREAALNSSV